MSDTVFNTMNCGAEQGFSAPLVIAVITLKCKQKPTDAGGEEWGKSY